MRVLIAALLVLSHAAGDVGVVTAQSVPDPLGPAYFTYTYAPIEDDGDDGAWVDAADPRASGHLVWAGDYTISATSDGVILLHSTAFRLTNDGGAWTGTGYQVMASEAGRVGMHGMAMLSGEDGY